jgi:hypothetical protein
MLSKAGASLGAVHLLAEVPERVEAARREGSQFEGERRDDCRACGYTCAPGGANM